MGPITISYWSYFGQSAYNRLSRSGSPVWAIRGEAPSLRPLTYHRRSMELPSHDPIENHAVTSLPAETGLSEIGLSVRTLNALRGVGCNTVEDVLRLDLSTPKRGLGRIAKQELLAKLERAGFSHPESGQPASEISRLERNLERIEERVDATLRAIAREVHAARQRLAKLKDRTSQT
jgi:hypothetical protein